MKEKIADCVDLDPYGQKTEQAEHQAPSRIEDVVIGVLVGLQDSATPLVVFSGNPKQVSVPARTTSHWSPDDIGCQVALLFEDGDPSRPLVIGRIQNPESGRSSLSHPLVSMELDGEQLTLNALRQIVLRCGDASITLTRAGKVIIKGSYVLSRSTGHNKIKGAAVDIN